MASYKEVPRPVKYFYLSTYGSNNTKPRQINILENCGTYFLCCNSPIRRGSNRSIVTSLGLVTIYYLIYL